SKRAIKKIIKDLKEGISFGADTAICPQGIIKPEDIQYRNSDIALPLVFNSSPGEPGNLRSYDARMLYETLLLIEKDELTSYLMKIAQVAGNADLLNIGATNLHMNNKESQQQKKSIFLKNPPVKLTKGKRPRK